MDEELSPPARLPRAIAGGLLLAIGLACLAFLVFALGRDLSLWVTGRTVQAEVTEQWVERIGEQEEGELTFRYFVRYRFTTPKGQVVSKVTTLGVREWSTLSEGRPVTVIYFPLYPEHARIEERQFIALYLCGYLPVALVGWAGLRTGWHLLRTAVKEEGAWGL